MIDATLIRGPFNGHRIGLTNTPNSLTMYPDDEPGFGPSYYHRVRVDPQSGTAVYEWTVPQNAKKAHSKEKHKHATEILACLMEGHTKALTDTGSVEQAAASLRAELEAAFLEEFKRGYEK